MWLDKTLTPSVAMASHLKLNYFKTRGLAEPIRFLLSYGNFPFDDNRIEVEHWHQLKQSTPFGKLPTLEFDGRVAYQPVAICRYLAKLLGIAGSDDFEAAQIDAVVDTVNELKMKMNNIYTAPDLALKEKLRRELTQETLPYVLSRLDDMIRDNGGYLVNGTLTWADLFFISSYEVFEIITQEDILSDYPNIQELKETIYEIPAIREWLTKRPFSLY